MDAFKPSKLVWREMLLIKSVTALVFSESSRACCACLFISSLVAANSSEWEAIVWTLSCRLLTILSIVLI